MSTIKVDNLQTKGGVGLYPARVWVNFNGMGTVFIRDDENISSITDNGTGNYTANFSNNLTSVNFSGVVHCKVQDNDNLDAGHAFVGATRSTSSTILRGGSSSAGVQDKTFFDFVAFS